METTIETALFVSAARGPRPPPLPTCSKGMQSVEGPFFLQKVMENDLTHKISLETRATCLPSWTSNSTFSHIQGILRLYYNYAGPSTR